MINFPLCYLVCLKFPRSPYIYIFFESQEIAQVMKGMERLQFIMIPLVVLIGATMQEHSFLLTHVRTMCSIVVIRSPCQINGLLTNYNSSWTFNKEPPRKITKSSPSSTQVMSTTKCNKQRVSLGLSKPYEVRGEHLL